MKPKMSEVFRLNEDPAASGAPAHLSLVRVRYNGAKEMFALGLCHLFLSGAQAGKVNQSIKAKVQDIEKALLSGDIRGADAHMESLGDVRYAEMGAEDERGADISIICCGAFYETHLWFAGRRGDDVSPIGALDNVSRDAKPSSSGRLFSISDMKEIGRFDSPKKVGTNHMHAGDFLLRLGPGGHYDRSWRIDLVTADNTAKEEDLVMADQLLGER